MGVVILGILREVRENIFKGKLRQSTLVILKQQLCLKFQ